MRYHSDSQTIPASSREENVPGGLENSELARTSMARQPVEFPPRTLSEPVGISGLLAYIRLSAACAAFDRD
ncbi:hypothetical protein [Tatumella citrea]|uniref:Uncharacterized protein n=1 Tax=Tatumella citrea TaxID=53336 RepID=A0A1Y0LF37_TATCI|nr:hypothetical protein [Tatumella citrea]ARU92648.1 hypothetical protein A7K98_01870 [Tatumella citrea]ARU96684.1 hypothetical protein A7K99_01870 [Tatumella citrea]